MGDNKVVQLEVNNNRRVRVDDVNREGTHVTYGPYRSKIAQDFILERIEGAFRLKLQSDFNNKFSDPPYYLIYLFLVIVHFFK